MSVFTGLAVVLGIGIGIGISYWYVNKKSKGLVQQAMDLLNNNGGKIPSVSDLVNTLKSEGSEVHIQDSNKEGEILKEDLKETPAPSPIQSNEKEAKDENK